MRGWYWPILIILNVPLFLLAGRMVFGSYGGYWSAFFGSIGLGARIWTIEDAEDESDALEGNFKCGTIILLFIPLVIGEDWFLRRMGVR